MATATSSSFTLQESASRDVVTLVSYSGPISWTTTPVAGDQIEYPTTVTVQDDGSITGSSGTYTVRHIVSATGAIQAVSHTLSASNSANDTIAVDPSINDSLFAVTLTSYVGPMSFTTTPVAGDQIIYPSDVSVGVDGSFTGANATYTLWHIIASTGSVQAISYTHSGANTAPTFGSIPDVVANQTETANFSIAATDPDTSDTLTYSHDVLPNGITRTGSTISGTYNNEETVLTTFTVQDDSGETGNDSDTVQILFSIARSGYTITTLTVNYANLNPDSPLIDNVIDSDLLAGDQVDYPVTVTDHVGNFRTVGFASDGLMTVTGSRSVKVENIYIRDSSNSYLRVGPFSITLVGTGPDLISPLEVVTNSETTSGGQIRFTTDEGSEVVGASGNYRLIVLLSGAPTPTKTQILGGVDSNGNPPLFDSGSQQQTANVEEVVTVTGLPTQGSGYWVFLALEDQFGGVTVEGPVTLATTTSGLPPVWSSIPDQSWSEGSEVSINFRDYSTDAVTFSISGLPSGTGITLNSTTGVLSGTPNTFDASGPAGTTTNYTFTVTATNATGSSQTTFNAGVYRPKPPVNIAVVPDQSWQENISVSLSLNTYITGATSYELQIDISDGTAELATYGLTFNSTTGTVTGTPNALAATNSPYTMRARGVNADGIGNWLNFTTTVSASAPPVFSGPIPNQTFTEGVTVSLDVSSYFTGASAYVLVGLPIGSSLTINNSGVISGTPNATDLLNSPYTVTVRASNIDGSVDGSFTVTVNGAVVPTLVAGFPDLSFAVGSSVSVTFANYINNATSYTVTGLPSGTGLIVTSTGIGGTFTQTDSDASPFVATVTGSNSDGSVSDSFQVSTLTASDFVSVYDPAAEFVKFYGNSFRTKSRSGTDGYTQIKLYNGGSAFLLNNLTNLECILNDGTNEYTLSRSSNYSSFELIPSEGKFNVRLGESGAPAGFYDLDVKYYDLSSPDGVVFTAYRPLFVEIK